HRQVAHRLRHHPRAALRRSDLHRPPRRLLVRGDHPRPHRARQHAVPRGQRDRAHGHRARSHPSRAAAGDQPARNRDARRAGGRAALDLEHQRHRRRTAGRRHPDAVRRRSLPRRVRSALSHRRGVRRDAPRNRRAARSGGRGGAQSPLRHSRPDGRPSRADAGRLAAHRRARSRPEARPRAQRRPRGEPRHVRPQARGAHRRRHQLRRLRTRHSGSRAPAGRMVRHRRRNQPDESHRPRPHGPHREHIMKRTAALLVGALLFLPALARAQAVGALAGVVTDESGAVMPGVTIDATNTATGIARTAVSGSDGYYAIPQVAPGTYTVKAAITGFKEVTHRGIVVSVGDTSRVDFKLAVGGVQENVTVSGAAPLVETAHATLGITIDQQKVVELPLNGRNFAQLGTLIPGVLAPPTGLGGATGDATPGGFGAATASYNVNGMRNQSNNFLIDGSNNNDTFNTGFVMRPPPDAIQEFKIETHSYTAEFGRNAGAVVNVVTKGGSNEFHGSGWEFNRNDAL